jgi:hypothetical protein
MAMASFRPGDPPIRSLRLGVLSTLAFLAVALPAAAGEIYGHGPIIGTVTAVSLYGNGSISAPYRNTPVGYQVRLPHGTWVYCRTSCSETLRVQTVDMFARENELGGYGTLQQECGILGCLHRSFTLPF